MRERLAYQPTCACIDFSLLAKYRYAATLKKFTKTAITFHTITGLDAMSKP